MRPTSIPSSQALRPKQIYDRRILAYNHVTDKSEVMSKMIITAQADTAALKLASGSFTIAQTITNTNAGLSDSSFLLRQLELHHTIVSGGYRHIILKKSRGSGLGEFQKTCCFASCF